MPQITLADRLEGETKKSLIDIAHLLAVKIPSKLRKADFAAALNIFILSHPERWLNQLPQYDLMLLNQLVKEEKSRYIEVPDSLITPIVESLSLVIPQREDAAEGMVRYYIDEDLRQIISPLIPDVLSSSRHTNRFVYEQLFRGITNLYGMLPYKELLRLMTKYSSQSEEFYLNPNILLNSLEIRKNLFHYVEENKMELFAQSSFLHDPDSLDKMLYERRSIPSLKSFTREEVLDAGKKPVFHIASQQTESIKKYMMERLDYSDIAADSILELLWYTLQTDGNNTSLISQILGGKLNSLQELQEGMNRFMDYCNQVPRWFLKGYSPNESNRFFDFNTLLREPPKLVAGPNMKAAGMDITPEMQEELNVMFRNNFTEEKIGRNDLCPCGSGKKYKKCCGAN